MFRFTIRDLLWLTVVVALGLAWRLDRYYHHSAGSLRRAATQVALSEFGWKVEQSDGVVEFQNRRTGEIDYVLSERP